MFSESLWVGDDVHIAICLICRLCTLFCVAVWRCAFSSSNFAVWGLQASRLAYLTLLAYINQSSINTNLLPYMHSNCIHPHAKTRVAPACCEPLHACCEPLHAQTLAPLELCGRVQEDRRNTSRDYQMCILKSGQKHQHAAAAGKPACLSYAQH